jgi:hypothetical protein
MKTLNFLTVSLFIAGILFTSNIFAQTNFDGTVTQIVRNTSPITYTVANPDGAGTTFSFIVTNGTILVNGAPKASPFDTLTAAANVSIQVRWDNTNKTSANIGTLAVSKTLGTCAGSVLTLNVQSWVAPSVTASSTTTTFCSGGAPLIDLAFQGKSNYGYTWQVLDASNNVVQGPTAVANVNTITTTVTPSGITTAGTYRFQITTMQDGFTDVVNNSVVTVAYTINPIPTINNINSSSNLTPRP